MGSPTSNPKVGIQLLPAAVVDAFADRQDLIVGQIGTGGIAVDGALNLGIHTKTDAQIRALFGEDELYRRIQYWLSGNGSFSHLDVIAVGAGGGATAASGSIAFSGTASNAGTLTVSAVDEELFSVSVSVSAGDTNTVVSAAVEAAFDALTRPVFTASESTGTVTLTANDVGTIGNSYGIKVEGSFSGLSWVITPFAGGATDPTVTSILDPIAGRRYTSLSWPEAWFSQINIAVDEFDDRFNVSDGVMDGVVFTGQHNTFADAKTAVASLNSQSLVVGGNNQLTNQPGILQPADWSLAYFQGVEAKRLTPNAPIASNIVSTNGPLDAIGGPALASLPLFNTPLDKTPVTLPSDLYSATEQSELEDAGYTTWGVNRSSNEMIMGPVVTTWTTDASGNSNVSFSYLNYVRTGSACREIFFNVLRSTYSQSRLTEGDLVAQRSIANAESIKATLLAVYRVLASQTLTQSGREAEKYFNDNTTVDVDLATGTVTIAGPLPIVTQIRTINYALQFSFSLENTGTEITF